MTLKLVLAVNLQNLGRIKTDMVITTEKTKIEGTEDKIDFLVFSEAFKILAPNLVDKLRKDEFCRDYLWYGMCLGSYVEDFIEVLEPDGKPNDIRYLLERDDIKKFLREEAASREDSIGESFLIRQDQLEQPNGQLRLIRLVTAYVNYCANRPLPSTIDRRFEFKFDRNKALLRLETIIRELHSASYFDTIAPLCYRIVRIICDNLYQVKNQKFDNNEKESLFSQCDRMLESIIESKKESILAIQATILSVQRIKIKENKDSLVDFLEKRFWDFIYTDNTNSAAFATIAVMIVEYSIEATNAILKEIDIVAQEYSDDYSEAEGKLTVSRMNYHKLSKYSETAENGLAYAYEMKEKSVGYLFPTSEKTLERYRREIEKLKKTLDTFTKKQFIFIESRTTSSRVEEKDDITTTIDVGKVIQKSLE